MLVVKRIRSLYKFVPLFFSCISLSVGNWFLLLRFLQLRFLLLGFLLLVCNTFFKVKAFQAAWTFFFPTSSSSCFFCFFFFLFFFLLPPFKVMVFFFSYIHCLHSILMRSINAVRKIGSRKRMRRMRESLVMLSAPL